MAVWSGLKDFVAGAILTAADLDTYLSGNTEYLLNSRVITRKLIVGSADVTKTGAGSDSFAAIDSTNLTVTITPKSTRVEVVMLGNFSASAGFVYLDFFIDGLSVRCASQYTGTNTNGLVRGLTAGNITPVIGIFSGLTPDTLYTITPYWRQTATGNTMTWQNTSDDITSITVREI